MPVTRKAVCEFYFHMARHTRATPAQCQRLLRYAATLQRIAENQCNGYSQYSNKYRNLEAEREERKQRKIQAAVANICVEISLSERLQGQGDPKRIVTPVFSGDPRGSVLKIRVPDGFTDDIGQEGICVPA